jgi:hypothetical protein
VEEVEMNGTKLSWTLATALALLAVIGLGGCGSNEAQDAAAPIEEPAVEQPATATPAGEPVDPRLERLEQRERELAERERELAEREQRVTDRLERLEASVERLARREQEMEAREAALAEPVEPAAPAEPVEPWAPAEPVEPWAPAEPVLVTLPASTRIEVAFEDTLSSESSFAGDRFRTTVLRDVWSGEHLAIPAGSEIGGFVAQATPQKKIGGQAQLVLEFDRLTLPHGEQLALSARFEQVGRPQKKKDAATIGGAAAGGALLGRVLGHDKSKGTALGAIVGAAVGTAVASNNAGDPVTIEPGMTTELLLTQPVELPVGAGR